MNETDDGQFQYNINFPPLCCTEAKNNLSEKHICKLIQSYYINTETLLCLPSTAILPPGFTVGEAALLHLRGISQPSHRPDTPKTEFIISCLHKWIQKRKRQIPLSRIRDIVLTWFNPEPELQFTTLKKVFSMLKLKRKGYTNTVRAILADIHDI